jgi:hypothetical protein
MRSRITTRLLCRLVTLLALAGMIQLAAVPGEAWAGEYDEYTDGYEGDGEDGPGTRWRECRAEAWADYNDCLMDDPDDTGNRVICYILWDLDAHACDRALFIDFVFPWKELFS